MLPTSSNLSSTFERSRTIIKEGPFTSGTASSSGCCHRAGARPGSFGADASCSLEANRHRISVIMERNVLIQSLAINCRKSLKAMDRPIEMAGALASISAEDIVVLKEVLACLDVLKTETKMLNLRPHPAPKRRSGKRELAGPPPKKIRQRGRLLGSGIATIDECGMGLLKKIRLTRRH